MMASRAASKPIQALQAATRALAEEQWNAARVQTAAEDRIGELVSAFGTMADKLRESRAQPSSAFRRTPASFVQTIEAEDQ